ncbi:CAMK family protein kinase [Trichomonas vaginalis G3]|uniref:CAMK family protein kinase n=1 Tax=Trichomonas vaginalis (strain ATCC PRA-98 / G3) TaxID=412133 RepID=A2G181_TRIV3|nr:protein serine/threonine kinase protein [Trichomonas vaginalis G3]EAX89075.1 CAMK family protein kinase [Trichomonas vaginalis G3]KAI5521070.1 protein serine/threonine kinase protein [Trichomonas vaginalis G3]|eukprot:XP_001302005.1 CAMK family protein kinase [Trichomonas vaginalis G3]
MKIEQGSVHGVYEFIKLLDTTDTYELWKARSTKLMPFVLIRVLPKQYIDHNRYGEEIKIHSLANFPFTSKFYQYFEEGELTFVVMEYLNDENLEEYISNNSKINEEQARIWFSQIISTLNYLDTQFQVYHGNLEACCFSLADSNALKLFDFEYCHYLDSSVKCMTSRCHPFYLSPEEIKNESNPLATTVWRCGVILYRMLTGAYPFEDDSSSELFTNILSMKPIIPSQISNDAKNLLTRMLTKATYERITFEEIMEHPFFVKVPIVTLPSSDAHIKSDILRQLERVGYNKADVVADLKAKLFTEKTAAYNILLVEGNYDDESDASIEYNNAPLKKSASASAFQIITQPKSPNSLMNKMKLRPVVPGRSIPIIPQRRSRSNSFHAVNNFYHVE